MHEPKKRKQRQANITIEKGQKLISDEYEIQHEQSPTQRNITSITIK